MEHPVTKFIADNFFWVLIAVLALNLFQRRKGKNSRVKRSATLLWAIFIFALYTYGVLLYQFKLSDFYLLLFFPVAGFLVYRFRHKIVPFKLKCTSCKKQMTFNEIFYDDDNICERCKEKISRAAE